MDFQNFKEIEKFVILAKFYTDFHQVFFKVFTLNFKSSKFSEVQYFFQSLNWREVQCIQTGKGFLLIFKFTLGEKGVLKLHRKCMT